MLPDYFYEVAASSTGKYHPKYALGLGGLVRHTKAAVFIAHELLQLEMMSCFSSEEKDLMICALILHDGWKHGMDGSSYTVATHPIVAADWIKNTKELNTLLSEQQIEFLHNVISSHMGQWNTDFRTKKEILPKPQTKQECFVHLCDYLASRKYLLFDFGNENYDPRNYIAIDGDLKTCIDKIIAISKDKIAESPENREKLYDIIAKYNDGRKNPNSINNVPAAEKILESINLM